MFKTLIFLLFSQLAIGGLWSIAFVPDQAGRSFFRFCGSACAILLAVGLLVWPATMSPAFIALLVCLALTSGYVALVVTGRTRPARVVLAAAGLAGGAGLGVLGYVSAPAGWPAWVAPAGTVYQLSSALFLGSVIFAMTLGHWYLVLPTLPIDPLRKLTTLMIAATAVKTVLLGLVLYLGAASPQPEIADTVAGFGRLQGLFFWARSLFGLAGPIVLCYMTWATVRLNATQSATGLLYVATILVLIGETMSRFIYHTTQLPV